MLRIREVQMQNFGPYRGTNELVFNSDSGVYVVYGENMRGKTTLLNAVRFALFGHVLGRSERQIDPRKLLNKAARADGQNTLAVQLTLDRDGVPIVIRRQWVVPENPEDDTQSDVFVIVEGDPIPKDDIDRYLHELLPEGVSRFFLFDGELLQQYEELLSDESETGRKITESIEQVLGVPVLTNLRADLGHALENARRAETRAAKKHKATQKIAVVLENLDLALSNAKAEEARIEEELEETRKDKEQVERLLDKSAAVEGLIADRRACQRQIEEQESAIDDKSRDLASKLENAWRWPLSSMLAKLRDEVVDQLLKAEEQQKLVIRHSLIRELREKARLDGSCAVCGSSGVSVIGDAVADAAGPDDDLDLELARERMALLKQIDLGSGGAAEAVGLATQIEEARAQLVRVRQRLEEIDLELSTRSPDEVQAARSRLKPLIEAFQDLSKSKREIQEDIRKFEQQIKATEKKLDDGSGDALTLEKSRRDLVGRLLAGATNAVVDYREALRGRVAEDASDLFLAMTTEPEFTGLGINKQYGLEIQLPDDEIQEIRSSGAEHVVALALLGALQKNAPLRSPLFIDSPFGRLDEAHTRNIVKALPDFAPQVILFVYTQELDPSLARSLLGTSLAGEYKLERVSAVETRLVS